MGLEVCVGVLADEDGDADFVEEQLKLINEALASKNLPQHVERTEGELWSESMFGYQGFDLLKWLAIHLGVNGGLPAPNATTVWEDDAVLGAFEAIITEAIEKDELPKFAHIACHSDVDGFYVPVKFNQVVLIDDDEVSEEDLGGFVGSSQRVLTECQEIAEVLGLPLDKPVDHEEIVAAIKGDRTAASGWKRYPLESHACLVMYKAAKKSVAQQMAIVFE